MERGPDEISASCGCGTRGSLASASRAVLTQHYATTLRRYGPPPDDLCTTIRDCTAESEYIAVVDVGKGARVLAFLGGGEHLGDFTTEGDVWCELASAGERQNPVVPGTAWSVRCLPPPLLGYVLAVDGGPVAVVDVRCPPRARGELAARLLRQWTGRSFSAP